MAARPSPQDPNLTPTRLLRQDEIVAVPIAALLARVITGELSGSRTAEHALLTANRVMLDPWPEVNHLK